MTTGRINQVAALATTHAHTWPHELCPSHCYAMEESFKGCLIAQKEPDVSKANTKSLSCPEASMNHFPALNQRCESAGDKGVECQVAKALNIMTVL